MNTYRITNAEGIQTFVNAEHLFINEFGKTILKDSEGKLSAVIPDTHMVIIWDINKYDPNKHFHTKQVDKPKE